MAAGDVLARDAVERALPLGSTQTHVPQPGLCCEPSRTGHLPDFMLATGPDLCQRSARRGTGGRAALARSRAAAGGCCHVCATAMATMPLTWGTIQSASELSQLIFSHRR